MLKDLIIREEAPSDYKQTELMIMRSFWNKYWPGCSEHFLARIIRASKDYLPEISRIAELNGQIVGAVYYTKAWIADDDFKHEIVTFGPLAVEPTLEGNDIGGALVRETIVLAKKSGTAGIVIMGEPGYYPRFGFKRGAEFGITDAWGNTSDALMVLPLNNDFSTIKGKFMESADFGQLENREELNKINEEFPKYRKVKVKDGFMQIFEQHLGVVESVQGDYYNVRYWEKVIPAKLADLMKEKPVVGSDVQFEWNHKGDSKITRVIKNMLDE